MAPSALDPIVHQLETERLQALYDLQVLDSPPEDTFDEAVRMAATICGTPTAIVNLLDRDRQWFKARVGMPVCELPREGAFCEFAIGRSTPLIIPDTLADEAFRDNPFVTGPSAIRFYAGVPLNTSDGYTVGTLCVADTVPRCLTLAQAEALVALGRQVTAQLELRAKITLLHEVIRDKERMERELRERTTLFTAFMDHTPTIAFIKDEEGRFVYYNRMFAERFALSSNEWIGKNVFDLFPKEFAEGYHAVDHTVLQSGVPETIEEASPGPGESTIYWRTHKFRIDGGQHRNGQRLLCGLSLDISHEREASIELQRSHAQLELANEQLTELSTTDGLTGLRNRRAFDARLAQAETDSTPASLILLDVDHFKSLNDSFGHSVGDDVLRVLAHLLNQHTRLQDYVARFGGEEFAILLPNTNGSDALAMAERLRIKVANFGWRQRPITISAGVSTFSSRAAAATDLIDAADAALYAAKHRGRNRVELASDAFITHRNKAA